MPSSSQRIVPLTGSDASRLFAESHGLIKANEIHTTEDQRRVFLEGYNVAPVWHGIVADEGIMLALTSSAARGVFPADMCYRADEDAVYMCISNRGETAADWIAMGAGGGGDAEFDNIMDGGAFTTPFYVYIADAMFFDTVYENISDGGPFVIEETEDGGIIDGGDFSP